MFFLRLLAMLNGGMVLVAAPWFLRRQGRLRGEDMETVIFGCAVIAMIAFSFFFIGLAGHRMRKSMTLRGLGGLLLAVPLITGVTVVAQTRYQDAVYLCVTMFCMAAILFVSFVYPGSKVRKHRPMRPRDTAEPYLETPSRL